MEITKENIAFVKRTLHNYYHLKALELEYRKLAFEWEDRIEDERAIQGICTSDIVGDGCSVSYVKDSYINQLIKEQAGYDQEAEAYLKQYQSLDRQNHIEQQLKILPEDQRKLLIMVFKKNMSYPDISKTYFHGKPSKQAISDRVNRAVIALMQW